MLSTSLRQQASCSLDADIWDLVGIACGPELKLCCVQLLSAADRQTDSPGLKSWEGGILTEGAKTICRGVQERKQVSLYLMSLEQAAKRTGVDEWKKLSAIICGSWKHLNLPGLWYTV